MPCAPINSIDQVAHDHQVDALDIFSSRDEGGVLHTPLVRSPLSFDGVRPGVASVAPALGAHTGNIVNPLDDSTSLWDQLLGIKADQ